MCFKNNFLYPSHIFFSSSICFSFTTWTHKSSSRPYCLWTTLTILGEDFGSQHVGHETLSEEEVMPQPLSLSLTMQSVECSTELMNTYLMLCTLHSGLSAVWAWGASWWLGRFPLCSHVKSVSSLIQKEILINYTATDSCFWLLLGMSDSVISLTDKSTLQFSK